MRPRSFPDTAAFRVVIAVATVLSGLSAGFFATYHYSVTRALLGVDDTTYVATFQAINSTIRSAEFGVIFFGSAVALIVALVAALSAFASRRLTSLWLIGALGAYAATLFITFTVHVPLNDALALIDLSSPDAVAAGRVAFEKSWNDRHLVRTVTALAAFVLTLLALIRTGGVAR